MHPASVVLCKRHPGRSCVAASAGPPMGASADDASRVSPTSVIRSPCHRSGLCASGLGISKHLRTDVGTPIIVVF